MISMQTHKYATAKQSVLSPACKYIMAFGKVIIFKQAQSEMPTVLLFITDYFAFAEMNIK